MSSKEDLARPEAYPGLGAKRVECVETHVSRVFLLERDVFKTKKPVDLGFLDFRDLAARKAACEAEVRLNARLAPEVYLGVEPVRLGEDGRARVGGSGFLVDFAVHMVRLPDERRADLLLPRGGFEGAEVDAVAARLAAFHAGARQDAETARFGSVEVVRANVEENFAQTRGSLPRYLRPEEAEELAAFQRSFLRERARLFEERARAGRVRDGHGDLRLEHVYLGFAREVTILDCIEFSDRFRFADVCADVAFLSMDLAAHGRVDLAERLLARYARDADDFDLYALVDFYESYRAFVRGKIAAMVASSEEVDPDRRRLADAEARRYFLLALSAPRRQALEPALVAVGGVIASGKSTVADGLALELGAPSVEADRTRKAMVGVAPRTPLREGAFRGAYDPAFSERVYAEVLRRAEVVLASGRSVVVDASFRSREARKAVRTLAARLGVPFRLVECRASAEVCRARLAEREREGGVSDGRLEVFDDFCARFDPVVELPPEEHIVLETARPLPESLARLRARLALWPPGLVA